MYELTENELLCVSGGEYVTVTPEWKVRFYLHQMAETGILCAFLMGVGAPFSLPNATMGAILDEILMGGFIGLVIGLFQGMNEYGDLKEGSTAKLPEFWAR